MSNEIRQPGGQPSGGEFASHDRAEAISGLLADPPMASAAAIQAMVSNTIAGEAERAHDDEREPHALTWQDALDDVEALPDVVLEHIIESDPQVFRKAFSARVGREGGTSELHTIAVRESDSAFLDRGCGQDAAADYVGERLDEYGGTGHFSRADYAEVGDDGISYGLSLNPAYLGAVVAGPQLPGESDDNFADRVREACPDYDAKLGEYFTEEYGAELLSDGGGMDNIEFYVKYEDGGAEKSTIEYMGDRVENETKLLQAKNEWEYGTSMQSKWAKKLGYSYELTTDVNRQVGDGRWVKDED